MQTGSNSPGQGKLFAVGIGPGNALDRTVRAEKVIRSSDVVVGYHRYIEHINDLITHQEIIASGMTREHHRCASAIDAALAGRTVSLVSSGDAGIYGMAGLALEMIRENDLHLDIEIVPGVSAAQAGAAALGAPLMLDYACVSLSDLLISWDEIDNRLKALAMADMVTVLYNPRSKKRTRQLQRAREIFLEFRPAQTLVGIVRNASLNNQNIIATSLTHMPLDKIDMRSLVIIGNSRTINIGQWMVTTRGYFDAII